MTTAPPIPQPALDRIAAGVSAGIITADQAMALRQLPVDSGPQRFSSVEAGDEPFSLFRGFRDVFLALGIIVLALGLGGIATEAPGLQFDGVLDWGDVGLAAALAAIAWGVGEWVTGRLRMPLASLVTAIAFSLALAATMVLVLGVTGIVDLQEAVAAYIAFAAFGIGAALFYARFRLPFALTLIAGSVAFLIYWMIDNRPGIDAGGAFQLYAGLVGLVTFLTALVYELADPKRITRFSENAFWLHLIAAPLVVYALTGGADARSTLSAGDAAWLSAVVVLLGLLALMIDRRAFIVSALIYLAAVVAYAISQSGMPNNVQFATTALVLGLFIVGLALGWHPLRQAFLRLLPESLSARLPNPVGPDALGG